MYGAASQLKKTNGFKWVVSTTVNSRQAAVINDANTFATVAERFSTKINVMLVTAAADIKAFTQQHNLEELWKEIPAIPGPQALHYTEPFIFGKTQHKTCSAAKESSIHTFLHCLDDRPAASISHCRSKSTSEQHDATKKN